MSEGIRLRLGAQQRVMLRLVGVEGERAAKQRATKVVALVNMLVSSGRMNVARHFANRAASARDNEELRGVETAVKALCSGSRANQQSSVTFRQFAERWVAGDLHRAYPQRVPLKRTAQYDR